VSGPRPLCFYIDLMIESMNIRTTNLDMCSKKDVCKAFALILYIKSRISSSRIDNFSYNKLHEITGLHAITLRKRMNTLTSLGLVKYEGNSVLFASVSSKHKGRNCKVIIYENYKVKDVEKSIYKTMLAVFQNRKDFHAHLQLLAKWDNDEPVSKKKYNSIRKKCCSVGIRNFVDFGISYLSLSKKLGVSLRKAFVLVSQAVTEGYISKENHICPFEVKNPKMYMKYAEEKLTKHMRLFFGEKIYLMKNNTYSLDVLGRSVVPALACDYKGW